MYPDEPPRSPREHRPSERGDAAGPSGRGDRCLRRPDRLQEHRRRHPVLQPSDRTSLRGYSADELIGRPVTVLIPPERQSEEREILDRIRSGERVKQFETVRLTKDG